MEKVQLLSRLEFLMNLAGVRRFKRIVTVLDHTKTVNHNIARYRRSVADCWEMDKFYDRITHKGYNRYSQMAIEYYFEDLMECLAQYNEKTQ